MVVLSKKVKSLLIVSSSAFFAYGALSYYKGNAIFYRNYIMPMIHKLDPESAHNLAIFAAKYRLVPASSYSDSNLLSVKLLGRKFPNPLGIAAGFDKNGEAIEGLNDIGFGFVEVGTVTPKAQEGNKRPRIFRLPGDNAVINRYGFNNCGHNEMLEKIKYLRDRKYYSDIIGVNLGKNKLSNDYVGDYVQGVEKFSCVADYLVINVSSPNTPGLRNLQSKEHLETLLKAVTSMRDSLPHGCRPPILLKLAPDLSIEDKTNIAQLITKKQGCKVDGLLISNTTVSRPPSLTNKDTARETGGLSGAPLADISTKMIAEMYKLTKGTVPIIGVGGVFSGKDAYEKIKAGASLVQLYTALVFEGPPCVTRIKKELVELLEADGYNNISEAVGVASKF